MSNSEATIDTARLPAAREPLGFWLYSMTLGLGACAAVAWWLVTGGVGEVGPPLHLVMWLAVVAVGDLLTVPLWGDVRFSLSLPVLLAAGMVLDPAAAVSIAFLGFFDAREWKGDFRPTRALANRGIVAISAGVASLVFHALGGDLSQWPSVLLPAGLALVSDCLVNVSLIALGGTLLRSQRLREVARQLVARQLFVGSRAGFLMVYACFGALGLLIATAYLHIGAWGLAVGVAPMFLAAELLRRERKLLDAGQALDEKSDLLLAASEQAVIERADERNRIASAIHDDVLQSIHYLMLHAQVIREDLRHGRLLQLEEDVPVLVRASQQTADLARSVVKGLRESPVGRGGVAPTLGLLVEEMREEFGGELLMDIEPVSGSPDTETYVYQVGREALVNAVRHSGGTRITIELTALGKEILLRVTDDGQGFDVAGGAPVGHFGLSLMKERVSAARGTLSIWSQPGSGTRIEALFPI